jgi:hypothetical protein
MLPYIEPAHPPGVVGFCTSGWPRIEEFWLNLMRTQVPNGTFLEKQSGTGLAAMFSNIAQATYDNPDFKWLWILGDDHTWETDLLKTMITRAKKFKCDLLVPLVSKKLPPFDSVLYHKTGPIIFHDLPKGNEPIEVHAAGTAGMLVQRRVLEAMKASGEPFFREGWKGDASLGEDIWFMNLARKLGFRVWVDPTLSMGHAPYGHSVFPERVDGEWYLRLCYPEGKFLRIPLPRPILVSEEEYEKRRAEASNERA